MMTTARNTVRLAKRSQRLPIRNGAVAVEFAFAAPVFFLMVFSCIEFCRLSMIRDLTQDAAYFAARHCMVPGATEEEAEEIVDNILLSMGTRGYQTIINDGAGINEDTDRVTVEVIVPIAQNALIAPRFMTKVNFTGSAVMKTERYDGYFNPSL